MGSIRVIFQICLVLIFIGAINWGLVGLDPSNDLIKCLFPNTVIVRSILYSIIGISGIIGCYIWLSYSSDICNTTLT